MNLNNDKNLKFLDTAEVLQGKKSRNSCHY